MLSEAFSSCAVMSSSDRLDAIGRPWRTEPAGDARVLLLVLPPLLPPLPPAGATVTPRPAAFCRAEEPRIEPPPGLPMVLSSLSMVHRSAIKASRSTGSPWFSASEGPTQSTQI